MPAHEEDETVIEAMMIRKCPLTSFGGQTVAA